jgi:hypothetical protein
MWQNLGFLLPCTAMASSLDVVSGLTGDLICTVALAYGFNITVHELKQRIAQVERIPTSFQRLLIYDRELQDAEVLSDNFKGKQSIALLRVIPDAFNPMLLEELRTGRANLQQLPPELRAVRQVAMSAVAYDPNSLQHVGEYLQCDRQLVMAAFKLARRPGTILPALAHVGRELWADREIVKAAINQDGRALEFASEVLRADRALVLKAVRSHGEALVFASKLLKKDPELVLTALGKHDVVYDIDVRRADVAQISKTVLNAYRGGALLQDAPKAIREDSDIVLTVVQWDGLSLQFASSKLTSDSDIALAAMSQEVSAVSHVADSLKLQPWFATVAISRDWRSFQYFPEKIRGDRKIAVVAVKRHWCSLAFATAAVKEDYQFLPEDLSLDWTFMLAAVEQDSLAIKYASEKLKQERTFVLAAVSGNGFSILHAHEKWQHDPFVVAIATKATLTNSVHTCMRGTCSLVIFVLIIIMCLVLAGAFGVGI